MQFSMEALNRIPVIPAKAGIQWPNCVTPVLIQTIWVKKGESQ